MRELIDQHLEQLIGHEGQLAEAARYAVLGGGKRLRPKLTLITAEALGADVKAALIPACAIELIHAYSLIHDDLPCMDDDDFRRGKPTVHRAFSEGLAVLTGDYLLTHAFHIISHAATLNDRQKVQLTQLLTEAAGPQGMIGGQILDLSGDIQTAEALQNLHLLKTGALISAAVEAGAIVANADDKTRQLLRSFGLKVGLAFQILDDVLDVTHSEAKHGRKISTDVMNAKTTYVTLFGIDGAKAQASQLLETAKAILALIDGNLTRLHSMLDQL